MIKEGLEIAGSLDPGINVALKMIDFVAVVCKQGLDYRYRNFLMTVETRYEHMTEEDRLKFKEKVLSNTGQKFASDYVVTVLNTPSMIVNAALALVYCDVQDSGLTDREKQRFISGVNGLTDEKVNFLINLATLQPNGRKSLFDKFTLNQTNFFPEQYDIDLDELFIYVSDFLSRGLLVSEINQDQSFGFGREFDPEEWSLIFCLSGTQRRFVGILSRAKELIR